MIGRSRGNCKGTGFYAAAQVFFCPAPVHFRTGDRSYPDGRRQEDPGSTEPPGHGTEQVSALSHTKNESMNKNSTDCLIKTVCGVFLYAYRGLRRNKAQCAESKNKKCIKSAMITLQKKKRCVTASSEYLNIFWENA